MDPKKIDKLHQDFPLCFRDDEGNPGKGLSYFACEDGWYDLIYDLCSKIEPLIPDLDESESMFRVSEVKEKFGGLRFYVYGGNEEIWDLITKAEEKSFSVCEYCGEKGQLKSGSWLKTLCENCCDCEAGC